MPVPMDHGKTNQQTTPELRQLNTQFNSQLRPDETVELTDTGKHNSIRSTQRPNFSAPKADHLITPNPAPVGSEKSATGPFINVLGNQPEPTGKPLTTSFKSTQVQPPQHGTPATATTPSVSVDQDYKPQENPKLAQPHQPVAGSNHEIEPETAKTASSAQTFSRSEPPAGQPVPQQPAQQAPQNNVPQPSFAEPNMEQQQQMDDADYAELRTEQPKSQQQAMSQVSAGAESSGGSGSAGSGRGRSGGWGTGSSSENVHAGGVLRSARHVKQRQRTGAEAKAVSDLKGIKTGVKSSDRAHLNDDSSSEALKAPNRFEPRVSTLTEAMHLRQTGIEEKIQEIQNLSDIVSRIRTRAQLLNNRGAMTLEAKLNPAHLGPIRVHIDVQGDQMRLAFTADRPEAVAALQHAQTELTSMMSDHGYHLTDCDVDQRSSQQSKWQETQNASNSNRHAFDEETEGESQPDDEETPSSQSRRINLGYNTLDLVA
jgi:flagellar hook-length control protein FliK